MKTDYRSLHASNVYVGGVSLTAIQLIITGTNTAGRQTAFSIQLDLDVALPLLGSALSRAYRRYISLSDAQRARLQQFLPVCNGEGGTK